MVLFKVWNYLYLLILYNLIMCVGGAAGGGSYGHTLAYLLSSAVFYWTKYNHVSTHILYMQFPALCSYGYNV